MNKEKKQNNGSGRKLRKKIWVAVLTVIAFASALIFIAPTVMTLINSFMTNAEINSVYGMVLGTSDGKEFVSDHITFKLIPDKVTFDQFKTVLLTSPDYLIKFWNSVILTFPVVLFQTFVALLASYGFARIKSRIVDVLFIVYIFIALMPYQVTMVPNYIVAEKLGILDTRWAVILPGIFSPFAVFLLTKVMKRIPTAFFEAAMLDGASEFSIFINVYIPVCRSAIFSVMMLIFIDYWNMVEQPLILLSDSSLHPLSVFLSKINTGETGLAFAVAVIYMVLPMLLFIYGEDYLEEGITYSGGVKG